MNVVDGSGETPLLYALANAHADAALLLLDAGARPNVEDKNGNTPLCLALRTAEMPNSLIERLAKGASLTSTSSRNPLFCIKHSLTSEAFIGVLMQYGADPNKVGPDGYTPLMKFAYEGNLGAVRMLLAGGAQVNLRSADGRSALEEAVTQGNVDTTECLLKAGADSSIGFNRQTLMEIATTQKQIYDRVSNGTMSERYRRIIAALKSDDLP